MLHLAKLFRVQEPATRRRRARAGQRRYRPAIDSLEGRCLLSSLPPTPAVQLPVVLTGLSSPLQVTNAGDGSNRLFIAEQAGVVYVLQPGATAPTVFLNLSDGAVGEVPGFDRVRAGGEQGLLGLAFHPD
jgi:hypothetical protein